ncbi:hypothetical protein LGZ99_22985 [Photorhabdus temperata]|uniref:CdiI immunity protein domain-containing protein n=1 Tax=Photorhabdus temperata subsp. temperata Meg1 TaxID=1393735 RepID=A0A081RQM0_PHOTE|nr:contact-dependent growth inhibition system immunity protein [Photorhabdus temperata]KER00973.1 hypothetical protein MEG1DRAFT_04428 [Photorhabdus temperata subsp. temperata Meg1]MCT8349983.1 hypothetical protein [Photorhabdus temperata]
MEKETKTQYLDNFIGTYFNQDCEIISGPEIDDTINDYLETTTKGMKLGFPDLDDQFNQMEIKHLRLHDGFGIGDMDNYFQVDRKNNLLGGLERD